MNDTSILQLFIKDPTQGFQVMFEAYWDKLYQYAYAILQSEDAAKDVVQALFVAIWEDQKKLTNVRSLKYYLYQAVKNNTLQYIHSHRFTELQEAVILELVYVDTTDEEISFKEQSAELQRRLAALPPRRREIFIMNRYDQLSKEEIAQRLGLSIRTVETHIGNALKSLKDNGLETGCIIITATTLYIIVY